MKPPPPRLPARGKGDGEREADRDRRIDGVAAAFQDVQPDARGRRFLTDDHAMRGDDRTRGGEGRDESRLIGKDGSRGEAKKERGRRIGTVSKHGPRDVAHAIIGNRAARRRFCLRRGCGRASSRSP